MRNYQAELQRYNDGRTDARGWCRIHTAEERAEWIEHIQWLLASSPSRTDARYWEGFAEIVLSWIDGQGA